MRTGGRGCLKFLRMSRSKVSAMAAKFDHFVNHSLDQPSSRIETTFHSCHRVLPIVLPDHDLTLASAVWRPICYLNE